MLPPPRSPGHHAGCDQVQRLQLSNRNQPPPLAPGVQKAAEAPITFADRVEGTSKLSPGTSLRGVLDVAWWLWMQNGLRRWPRKSNGTAGAEQTSAAGDSFAMKLKLLFPALLLSTATVFAAMPKAGDTAPPFAGHDQDGKIVTLTDFAGKRTVFLSQGFHRRLRQEVCSCAARCRSPYRGLGAPRRGTSRGRGRRPARGATGLRAGRPHRVTNLSPTSRRRHRLRHCQGPPAPPRRCPRRPRPLAATAPPATSGHRVAQRTAPAVKENQPPRPPQTRPLAHSCGTHRRNTTSARGQSTICGSRDRHSWRRLRARARPTPAPDRLTSCLNPCPTG